MADLKSYPGKLKEIAWNEKYTLEDASGKTKDVISGISGTPLDFIKDCKKRGIIDAVKVHEYAAPADPLPNTSDNDE